MKVVIIGSGNVATHIAKALHKANVQVSQIWSYHYENASLLAKEVNADAINELSQIDTDATICLIAVKDDAIAEIIPALQNFKGIVAHTSGSVSIDIFAGKVERYGVLYPLQTFSKTNAIDFSNIPLCLEAGDEKTLAVLRRLASALSTDVVEIESEKRKMLHLAAVFACNFTNHLYALAQDLLVDNKIDFDLLRPLIAETANKVQHELPKNVQTGPAIRNDLQTLKKQEELLKKQPNLLEIYRTLSESIKKSR